MKDAELVEQWLRSTIAPGHDAAVVSMQRVIARIAQLDAALREIVNTLGPEHFSGELEGLVAEGNEALRVARAALSSPETE